LEAKMSEDVTLSIDSEIAAFANDFSRRTNQSLSRIIENYLIELKDKNANELPEDLQELYGIFEGKDVPDKKELRRMFHEKYND
jgi:hypothetical protein